MGGGMFEGVSEELPEKAVDRVILLQDILVNVSESGSFCQETYSSLRQEFLNGLTRDVLPEIVVNSRTYDQLWSGLKEVASGSGSWKIRRKYLYDAFLPLLESLEKWGLVL